MALVMPFMYNRKRTGLKLIAAVLAVVCLVGILSRTAQAANTYVITDGDAVQVYTTHASDPAKVLQEAGVNLSKDDYYTTKPGDGVSEINIQRAQSITVHYGKETLQVSSYGETLQELFVRLGVAIDASAVVSAPLDTVTFHGMQVRVDWVNEAIEHYTVEIPFQIVYLDDPTLPEGQENILSPGKPGQTLCTAEVTYRNGDEISRNVRTETVIAEPVKQIVAVGTGEKIGQTNNKPIIGEGFIVLPTGEVLTYTHTDQYVATAYTHLDEGCDEYTANGARVKWGVVAVDPSVIPYGTRMFIVSNDGQYIYGLSTAEDCGGAIKNKRLDLYMPTLKEAFDFCIRNCTVYFLGDADWRDNI